MGLLELVPTSKGEIILWAMIFAGLYKVVQSYF